MKTTIRTKCFETNSSSTHSISLDMKADSPKVKDQKLTIIFSNYDIYDTNYFTINKPDELFTYLIGYLKELLINKKDYSLFKFLYNVNKWGYKITNIEDLFKHGDIVITELDCIPSETREELKLITTDLEYFEEYINYGEVICEFRS